MRNLEIALKQKNISNEAVAKLLNIHRNSLRNKLNGKTDFSISEAFKIKRDLLPEFDMDFLFADQK